MWGSALGAPGMKDAAPAFSVLVSITIFYCDCEAVRKKRSEREGNEELYSRSEERMTSSRWRT